MASLYLNGLFIFVYTILTHNNNQLLNFLYVWCKDCELCEWIVSSVSRL